MSESILNDKTRSLIAVGASIAANCQPCLNHHVSKALANGLNKQEIAEAIEVGKAVRSGAGGSMDKLVAEMKRNDQSSCSTSGDTQSSCCGN